MSRLFLNKTVLENVTEGLTIGRKIPKEEAADIGGDDYTINLLNLNSYRLKEARKAVYGILEGCDTDTIKLIYPENDMKPEPFINVVRWDLKQLHSPL